MGLDVQIRRFKRKFVEANQTIRGDGIRLLNFVPFKPVKDPEQDWIEFHDYRKQEAILDSILFIIEDRHYYGGSGHDYILTKELLQEIKQFKFDPSEMGCQTLRPEDDIKNWNDFLVHVDEILTLLEQSDEFDYVFDWC
jgi:hypothetical protein